MVDKTSKLIIYDIRRAIIFKQRELSELDLMLDDYQTEHFRLICELRKLQAQLRDAEEATAFTQESKSTSPFSQPVDTAGNL